MNIHKNARTMKHSRVLMMRTTALDLARFHRERGALPPGVGQPVAVDQSSFHRALRA